MSLIVIVQNVSNLAPVSDYRYTVLVGDGTPERSKLLAEGTVLQHDRSQDWQALIRRVLVESGARK